MRRASLRSGALPLFFPSEDRYCATASHAGVSSEIPPNLLKNVATPRKGDTLALQMIRAAAKERLR